MTLTRIYTLLHGYQTLVREIATPTLQAFVEACLQLIKHPSPGRPPRVPASFTEAVASALSTIIPLYPTTLRPFGSQIRSSFKPFLAPTSADPFIVPQTLKDASRRLIIAIHHTAPKNGSGEEWAKGISSTIKDCHATANLVFRAVQEYWESTTGYNPPAVSYDEELRGGGDSSDELPPWSGLHAGAERLIGLLELLADHFKLPTRSPVTVPVSELMDLALRITLVRPPSAASLGRGEDIQLNAAIGREEKDELWGVLPQIHLAVVELHLAIIQRLKKAALPYASDVLDQTVRVFSTARDISNIRESVYRLAKLLFALTGPTLPKITVDSASTIIQSCCRDLLQASGQLREENFGSSTPSVNGTKPKEGSSNADVFLNPQASSTPLLINLDPSHLAAAETLLVAFLTHLPQKYLASDMRGLIDRTAILSSHKAAMLASCLHPYKDKNGRYNPSILPFLVQQFPHDQEVEVLRTNLRGASSGSQASWDPQAELGDYLKDPVAEQSAADPEDQESPNDRADEEAKPGVKAMVGFAIPEDEMEVDSGPTAENAFMVKSAEQDPPKKDLAEPVFTREESNPTTLKRKGSEIDPGSPKKLSKGKPLPEDSEDSDDNSENGSIEIDPTFSDDGDEDDEGEEGEG